MIQVSRTKGVYENNWIEFSSKKTYLLQTVLFLEHKYYTCK